MAKRKVASASRRPSGGSLSQLSKRVSRLDRELVKRLNERAKLMQQIAKFTPDDEKRKNDTRSEQELLEILATANKGPLQDSQLRSVFREVVSGCRALVHPQRVAYLGPEYSYSYLATIERFGESVDLAAVATIAAVFEEFNRGHVEFGVVPLENSTDGRVVDTLGMFARLPARICGEVQLRIHHNLLAKCRREEIQEVYSKPQALSQCRDWLAKHVPWARMVEMTSTATAAKLAASKQGAAAVASRLAASSYGLDIVAENIEDNQDNITRFAIIGSEAAPRTGKDKTAMMFEIPHKPGSLADVLGIFKRVRLNMTWIESFPMSGGNSEYLFFVELMGHQNDAKLRNALESLKRKTVRLEVLGSYARSRPLD
jgi:chorismate mutase/prephenate dehydratase